MSFTSRTEVMEDGTLRYLRGLEIGLTSIALGKYVDVRAFFAAIAKPD